MPAKRVPHDGMEEYQIILRRILHERGISYEELGKRAGVAKNSISLMLNGHDVRIGTLRKIAKALDVDMAALFAPTVPVDVTPRPRGQAPGQDDLMEAFRPALAEAIANMLLRRGAK